MYIKGFSPSKLNVFDECPAKFRYKYVHYLPEEYNKSLSRDALQFGSYIHKILEDGVDATSEEELFEHAKRLRETYHFKSRDKDVEKCIKNFFKFNAALEETVSTEMKFKITVREDLELNGIIDRVVKSPNGRYLVIDYKTSKREKTKRELYNDPQLMIYTAAMAKMFEVKVTDIIVAHYYPITGNLVTVKYLPQHVNGFLKRVDAKKWIIRKKKEGEFKPRRNQYCDWCGYKELCPLFGGTSKMLDEAISKKKVKKKTPLGTKPP
mgnify:FL=1|tara:strand:- start:1802 stop:2599 length:798 start_codon:yes stop_codon:yes gene_type:complete